MDPPPPTAFSGRRRSSVLASEGSGNPPPTSSPTPRKASAWDSAEAPLADRTASDISARRASAATGDSSASSGEHSTAGSIAGRKASSWDEPLHDGGGGRSSISDIAGRKATKADTTPSPWDRFAGPPPSYEGMTWDWMSEIQAITTSNPVATLTERSEMLYKGNVDYIFDNFKGDSLEIGDIKAVMYAYGVEGQAVEDIAKKIDTKMNGVFSINGESKQILVNTNMRFSEQRDPLNNLRQGSKCFQLLSPLHFAGYIFEILTASQCLVGQPPFMLLGMYGILGVLMRPTNDILSTKNVETFISMWRLLNPDEARDLRDLINDDYNGSISGISFYNLLYRRNAFGKQRIAIFDTNGPYKPSFFFPLLDQDGDGFLLPADLRSFAAIFARAPSNEVIDHVIGKLDLDGDGKVNVEDFLHAMMPVLEGMKWEFWLVAILLTLKL